MIKTFSLFGYEGTLVSVEVDLRRGIPAVDIVGLSDSSVSASRERVRASILNSGFDFPSERVLVSLSPADLRKDGASFDLPTALAILAEKEGITGKLDDVFVIGELALNGEVRPVKGVVAALQSAIDAGIKYAIIPCTCNEDYPEGIKVARVGNLEEAFDALLSLGSEKYFKEYERNNEFNIEFEDADDDLDSIEGHDGLKYAMAVAVAGHHNIMAYGAPGSGKTMVFQRMPDLMPHLLPDERKSVERMYSLTGTGLYRKDTGVVRPFRQPHQTASLEGMCGGGINCLPGEISLAHNGVLFLDESAEFRSSILQMMRVPLESHQITLSRAGRTTTYPANFQLVMATNPCPCGNYGSKDKMCLCSAKSIELYWRKFSAPLLDKVAIRYNMNEPMEFPKQTLESLRSKITLAWKRQLTRQGKLNNDLTPEEMGEYINMSGKASEMLDMYIEEENPSARKVAYIKKMARTIADMNDTPKADLDFIEWCDMELALKLNGEEPFDL